MNTIRKTLDVAHKDIIENHLRLHHGCVAAAARSLKMSVQTVWWQIRRLGITPAHFRNLPG